MSFQARAEARKARLAAKLGVSSEFVEFLLWNLLILYLVVVLMFMGG